MADIEVGDLVARITLDDTGLDKSLAQIQREMKLVASEFEKASASLEVFGSEEDKLRAKSDQLTKQIALQGQRVELLRQEFKKAAQEKGEDAVATQKLAVQLNKAEAALAKMQVELQKTNKELADQPSRMAKWSSGLKDFGNHLQSAGQEIATSFGVAGAAISAALGYAVNTAADFEAQMDRVGAIAEASAADLDAMSDAAMDLGAKTSKSASEVAQGMEMMAAMGFKANEIIAAMPGVIAAAEASGTDMALVADTMAVSLRTFGLEASQATHVADVLAKTANMSAANIEGMAYVLKYAAAPAHTLGMSLEELAASAAIMADAGIRGETAGTTLRSALLSLTAPSKEASKELENLKVKITDAQGNMLPFADIIAQLKAGMQGWGNAQKAAALETLFGKEAVSGMMAVIEAGPEKIRALTAELQNSTGASAQAAAQMKDNLKGALEQLSGAFETMQITIGNALIPVIQSLAGALQSVVDWFNQLDPSVQQFIALSAAAGAALLTLIGALGAVMAAVGLAASGLGALGLSLSAVSAAILPVTAAIAGLTAAGILLYQNWDTISANAKVVWNGIVSVVKPAVDEVASFITKTFGDLAAWWKSIWPDLQVAFMNIWNAILAYTRPTLEAIKAVFDAVWPYIKNITVAVWETIKTVINSVITAIKGSMEIFIGLFTGDWDRMWNGVKMSAQAGWDAIKAIFSGAIDIIYNLLNGLASGISAYFQQIGKAIVTGEWWSAFVEWLSNIPSLIGEKLSEWGDAIGNWFIEQKSMISSLLEQWWINIGEWFSSIPSRISEKLTEWGEAIKTWAQEQHQENIRQFSEWWSAISEWFSSIPSRLQEKLIEWKNAIVGWFSEQKENISAKMGEWWESMKTWFSSIPQKLGHSLGEWWNTIGTWFSEIPGKISAKLEEWWTAIKNWFSSMPEKPEIKNAGSNIVNSLVNGAAATSPSEMDRLGKMIVDGLTGALAVLGIAVLAAGREIIKRFIEGVKSIDVVEIGRNIVQGLAQGIESLSGWIKQKVLTFVEGIGKTIKEFFGIQSPSRLMSEYGRYIVEGLWEGIQSMASWIKSNVTQFASNIANTIKQFFGIASPSRLMAEYGRYISEGLAVGMRENEKAVADAAKAQADIVKAKTKEAKDAAIAHWQEMQVKVKSNADLMAQAVTFALDKVRETTQLELAISRQEFELFAATLGNTTTEQAQKLQAQMELLRIELATSKETVDVLNKAYDEMVKVKGENSVEAQKLYLELLKEQTAYAELNNQLKELESNYQAATRAAQQLIFEQGRIYENINGKWVQVGGKGYPGSGEPYNPPGIPDWLDTSNNGGGGGEKEDSGRTRPKDTDREGAYQKDVDKDNFAGSVNTNVRKAAKEVGDSIKEAFDKVKDAFRFPGLATGGTVTKSGWTWVGENGPELLRLPRAAEVTPPELIGPRYGVSGGIDYNRLARSMAAVLPTGPIYVTIPAKDLSEMRTITDFFNRIQQVARARG
jgi:TP901 family phage tail tape measure protein